MAKAAPVQTERDRETFSGYQRWLEMEGLPVITGFDIKDVRKVELGPWKRLGGLGAYVRLYGSEDVTGMYICEIPPGESLKVERALFEKIVYVVRGQGRTVVWNSDGKKASVDWQKDSVFSIPLNTHHQFHNLSKEEPARFYAVTTAPFVLNLYRNTDFIYNSNFDFSDRYAGEEDYFTRGIIPLERWGETAFRINHVRNIREVELLDAAKDSTHGIGYRRRSLTLAGNTLYTFVAEFPSGTYTGAHWHAPGFHILILNGEGFTLMWPRDAGIQPYKSGNGDKVVRLDWVEGSLFVPPGWFHQQFSTGPMPVLYCPTGPGFMNRSVGNASAAMKSTKEGGNHIDYDDEDPNIRELFEEELKKKRVKSQMGEIYRAHPHK